MFRLFGLTLLLAYVYAKVDYTGHRLISIQAKNAAELRLLKDLEGDLNLKLDFWTEPSLMRPADIHVPPTSYGRLRRALMRAGIEFEVRNENLQDLIDKEAKSMMGRSTVDIENNYLTFEEIKDFVLDMEAEHDTVRVDVIGLSYDDRVLIQVKVAQDLQRSKPAIVIECGAHAREWLSVSTCLNLIKTLATDETMLKKYDWYIIPCLNPDGYMYTVSDRLWRKNMQRNDCSGWWCCPGIDLNRNWDAKFGEAGTSDSTCSDIYHGGVAFSAPETYYFKEAITALQQTDTGVTAFFSIHCYSQFLLVPWGYTKDAHPSDDAELRCVANKMVKALHDVYNTTFLVGTPGDLLNYEASGGAYDWAKMKAKIEYSFTYELRPSANQGGDGFIQPTSQIKPTAVETIASLREFAEMDLNVPCTS